MRKVKEYLDKYFFPMDEHTIKERKNGHLGVFGNWQYPKNYKSISYEESLLIDFKNYICPDHIRCFCNNETMTFDISINNKYAGYYGYLQTYEHLPRNGPDKHGYYQRSTDEEVIRYIDSFYQEIAKKEIRKRKLQILNEI